MLCVKSGASQSSILVFFNSHLAFWRSGFALFKPRFVILLLIFLTALRILNFRVFSEAKVALDLYIIQKFLFVSSRSNRIPSSLFIDHPHHSSLPCYASIRFGLSWSRWILIGLVLITAKGTKHSRSCSSVGAAGVFLLLPEAGRFPASQPPEHRWAAAHTGSTARTLSVL